ncbi:hypothetical protein [Virgibacillus pantothenticus]|uniref:hypothetical protein n=1 Tax=Virgibacillus pantothenticus TaxID=1473 RepID=UPI0012FF1A2F|nr:hypothetical protein [Virgibacillus pantothenticus]MED3736289.1 hypothetical protein [Virgibacillus pantothenticus]QTY15916.1 hypothetical protein KBP50_19110 [Virgibacillus pantothenticus]
MNLFFSLAFWTVTIREVRRLLEKESLANSQEFSPARKQQSQTDKYDIQDSVI